MKNLFVFAATFLLIGFMSCKKQDTIPEPIKVDFGVNNISWINMYIDKKRVTFENTKGEKKTNARKVYSFIY
jgi:hypothetical protein